MLYQIEVADESGFVDLRAKSAALWEKPPGPRPKTARPARAVGQRRDRPGRDAIGGDRRSREHGFRPPLVDDSRRAGLTDRLAEERALPLVALDQRHGRAGRTDQRDHDAGKPGAGADVDPMPGSRRQPGQQRRQLRAVGDVPRPDARADRPGDTRFSAAFQRPGSGRRKPQVSLVFHVKHRRFPRPPPSRLPVTPPGDRTGGFPPGSGPARRASCHRSAPPAQGSPAGRR